MRKVWDQTERKTIIQVPCLGQGPEPLSRGQPTNLPILQSPFNSLSCVPLSPSRVPSLHGTGGAGGHGGCDSLTRRPEQNKQNGSPLSQPTHIPATPPALRLQLSWEPLLPQRLKTSPGAVGGDWIPALREVKRLTLPESTLSV